MRFFPPVLALRSHRVLALVLALAAVVSVARPASALRFMSYNLLNYDNEYSTRNPAFRTVISGIGNVDILAVQEAQDLTAMSQFKTGVLDVIEPGQWAIAPFFNDPSMSFNQGLFYRTSAVTVVEADTLGNYPRDISWFRLRPTGYSSSEAELVVFVTHFKASTGYETDRYEEAQRLRLFMNTHFPAGTNMLVCGDFNVYTSTEPAYIELTESQANNTGRVQDPINTPGSWHNSYTYRYVHTQSTRTGYLTPNDGGSTGGMDDRFDFVLPTYSLADGEKLDQLANTYTAYGQDGLHFNSDINASPTNAAVGQTIADALQRSSDHLPIFMDFQVPAIVSADASLAFGTVIVGATAEQTLTVENVATAPADDLDYSLVAPVGFTVPGGPFQDATGGGGNLHTVAMLTTTAGSKGGNLVIGSDDVDHPGVNVALSGTVKRHADPSLSALTAVLADTLDFGTLEEGQFGPDSVRVTNLGYDALQVLLNVYDAAVVGGDGRFDLPNGFNAQNIGDPGVWFVVDFDDAGAATTSDTTYTATLTFSNRDEQGIPGAADLDDLTVYLKATVKAGTQTAVGDPTAPGTTLLRANYPNPFRAGTRIQFALARGSEVRLTVFDVQGRKVKSLVRGWLNEGEYDRPWDGTADNGRDMPPGVYFYRLDTGDYTATRRMIKLQ